MGKKDENFVSILFVYNIKKMDLLCAVFDMKFDGAF